MYTQLHIVLTVFAVTWSARAAEPPKELLVGFKATPDPSIPSFQPLLTDSNGNYSLGFLRVNSNQLSLSVLHVSSSVPLWSANTTRLPKWGNPTHLLFNGSLILSDPHSGVFWSTHTSGHRVFLSNTSNLVVDSKTISWQSFDFPSDTLVENQNFTSAMALVSANGLYSMRLGPDFMGLYAKFLGSGSDYGPGQIYLKHRALEAKADIVNGQPIYMVLKPDGYLGIFQNGSSVPNDVQSFNTFQQTTSGVLRVRLESDGNLKGYYWTGSNWDLDYQAISDPCELPSSCGSYSLCTPHKECTCLDNTTSFPDSGGCAPPQSKISGDFCGAYDNRFKVLRKTGVELPFKELMGYKKMASLEMCEGACEINCTCWGAVYSNFSGFCYTLNYPIQTLSSVGDETKMGYFKVREGARKKRVGAWVGLGLGIFFGAVLVFLGVVGLGWYKVRSKGVKGYYGEDEGAGGVGPYKDLGAASFRSIELCER